MLRPYYGKEVCCGGRKLCLWNEPFAALRDSSLSVSVTLTVMKTRATAAAREMSHWADWLSGLMESIITGSPCPEADGNKLSRNHLWMRGQGERCAWFLDCISLVCRQSEEKSPKGCFLKSHLIYLSSSASLPPNQPRQNVASNCFYIQCLMYPWCGALGLMQLADLNQGKVTVILNAWGPSLAETLLGTLDWK